VLSFSDKRSPQNTRAPLLQRPFFAPVLFINNASDARDHCANERTFLSWLRLSIYLALVAMAIVISFRLKHQPTPLEQRVSLPLGLIFWFVSLACLASGLAKYVKTVTQYSRRRALVQSGWKTEMASTRFFVHILSVALAMLTHVLRQIFTVVATTIVASCILFLTIKASNEK